MRNTHTYALLEISQQSYEEIHAKFLAAGYDHVFHTKADGSQVIDMQGIAITPIVADKKR